MISSTVHAITLAVLLPVCAAFVLPKGQVAVVPRSTRLSVLPEYLDLPTDFSKAERVAPKVVEKMAAPVVEKVAPVVAEPKVVEKMAAPVVEKVAPVVAEKMTPVIESVEPAAVTAVSEDKVSTAASAVTGKASSLIDYVSQRKVASPPVVSSTMSGDKAPSLLDYFSQQAKNPTPPGPPESLGTAQEKLLILKQNFLDLTAPIRDSAGDAAGTVKGVAAGGTVGAAAVGLPNLNELVDSLRLSEFGIFYLAGFAVLLALLQRNAGKESARKVYELKLQEAEGKVIEAAESATLAAQGAEIAKKLATEATIVKPGLDMLESSKIKALEVEKEMMQKELEELKQETIQLKTLLKVTQQETPEPEAEEVIQVEVAKEVIPQDPKENEKILDIIKGMDKENSSKKVKVVKGSVEKATPKKVAAKKVEVVKGAVEKAAPKKVAAKKVKVVKGSVEKATAKRTGASKKKAAVSSDWSTLSDSALKRKTVKDLSAYLSEKGVEVTTADGKPRKKADLISEVKNIVVSS